MMLRSLSRCKASDTPHVHRAAAHVRTLSPSQWKRGECGQTGRVGLLQYVCRKAPQSKSTTVTTANTLHAADAMTSPASSQRRKMN